MKTHFALLVSLLLLGIGPLTGSLAAQQKKNDSHLQTRLIVAIRKNSLHDVKQAVAAGANAGGTGYEIKGEIAEGLRPLQQAASQGALDLARFLVAKGAPVDGGDIYGTTPLMDACQAGHVQMAKWLLQHGAKVDAEGMGGTALFEACSFGHVAVVQLLLQYKANVNYRDAFQNRTPLFYAASQGHSAVVKLLLKNRANVNARNKDGETALTWAKEKKQGTVIALLIAAGATK